MKLTARLRQRVRRWARQRQGLDSDPVTLHRRRIYILPTRQGVAFGALTFVILVGAMNYNNSLGIALAFLLGGVMLVTMHHCHRNLDGLEVAFAGVDPVFAGQSARFRIRLSNLSSTPRYGLTLTHGDLVSGVADLDPDGREELSLDVHTTRRGTLVLDRYGVATTFPLGLFRAWTWVHQQPEVLVYPKPAEEAPAPPPTRTDTGGAQDDSEGDSDFAGLRSFRDGDSPRQIAWKAYARGQELLVKQYAGTDVATHWFDFEQAPGAGVEQRLSTLCRWIVDARRDGLAYGLRLPGEEVTPNLGAGHDRRCLGALALY